MPGRKTNNDKNPQAREEWMKGKKIGRPKQIWVEHEEINIEEILGLKPLVNGHWEKV